MYPVIGKVCEFFYKNLIMKFEFEKSAVLPKDYPIKPLPEVGIVGRSNSGKSSVINAWTQSRIAKVSGQPGKTRLLNFFNGSNKYRLVDMPGYGFAKRSPKEKRQWEKMIETYLSVRSELKGLLLIMDIRRSWSEEEQMLVDWASSSFKPVYIVLNKADKVNQKERHHSVKSIKDLGVTPFVVSAKSGKGIDELIQVVWNDWVIDTASEV